MASHAQSRVASVAWFRLSLIMLTSAAAMSGCRTLIGNPFNSDGTSNGTANGSNNGKGSANGNNGAGTDGNGGGELDANGCLRASCTAQGAKCGFIDDGCGGQLDCSAATFGEKCDNGTVCDAISHTCVVCVAKTCQSENKTCGTISDGCGGTLNCTQIVSGGMGCPSGTTCGGGGTPGQCGCRKATCQELNARCGTVSDGCGGTLDCNAATGGGCGSGLECDNATNQCFIPNCKPSTCADLGNPCGLVSDGCGRKIACSQCPTGQLCDSVTNTCLQYPGDGAANGYGLPSAACGERECGRMLDACGFAHDCGSLSSCLASTVCRDNQCVSCSPITVCPPRRCGSISNGCSGSIICGNGSQTPAYADVCDTGEVCDQLRGVCVDPSPATCAAQGKNCGFVSDGVGGLLDCGPCTAPETCGGSGTQGVCGLNAATRACLAAGIKCGAAEDACGNDFTCGSCDQGTQKCTAGMCVQCPPTFTCAANYPGQCGNALSDGCNGTIDCSGTCAAGTLCNPASGICEVCEDPCIADAPPDSLCTDADDPACGTINNCGTKTRCGTTYTCGSLCTGTPGAPGGGLVCVPGKNQCCQRDPISVTCGAAQNGVCGQVIDNCNIAVDCVCTDTGGDFACQTSPPGPGACVNCDNVCDSQNRECGNAGNIGAPGAGGALCSAGTCGTCPSGAPGPTGQSCASNGACCDSCQNRYYGALAPVGISGPSGPVLGNRGQCGFDIDLDPAMIGPSGLTGAICPNNDCQTCPAANPNCVCDAATSPHACTAGGDSGEIGACLNCADVCAEYRGSVGASTFPNKFCGKPGSVAGDFTACNCACDAGQQCNPLNSLCCIPDDPAVTCRNAPIMAPELCGVVMNNCNQPVNCACADDGSGPIVSDLYCAVPVGTNPSECHDCATDCSAQTRECGVPAGGVGGPTGPTGAACAPNACGACAAGDSCATNGACCQSCTNALPPPSDPDGPGGVSGVLQRCATALDANPDAGSGSGGPACPNNINCLCTTGTCFCDAATNPRGCAPAEVGFCYSCAQIQASYLATHAGFCGTIPGTTCTVGCGAGNTCNTTTNTCTTCAAACAGRECGNSAAPVAGCSCGTCVGGSGVACVAGQCCATCNYYTSMGQCGAGLDREVGQGASPQNFGTPQVCGAADLTCNTCPGGTCSGGACICSPSQTANQICNVASGAPSAVGAGGDCETQQNSCGADVACACAGGNVACGAGVNAGLCCRNNGAAMDTCCQPATAAAACGNPGTVGSACTDAGDVTPTTRPDGCGGIVNCPDCTGANRECASDSCCSTSCGGSECGSTTKCGTSVNCGACSGTNGDGAVDVCNSNTCCRKRTIAQACGTQCGGTAPDGCGGNVACPASCPGGSTCFMGQCCNNSCGPNDCGVNAGRCGGTDCGTCLDNGGTGGTCQNNLCCQPATCGGVYNLRCGTLSDQCGGSVSCSCTGIRGCSATNCTCPDPNAAATLPAVQQLCAGKCQVQIWVGPNGSGGLMEMSAPVPPANPAGPNPNGSCQVNCSDCPNGGG